MNRNILPLSARSLFPLGCLIFVACSTDDGTDYPVGTGATGGGSSTGGTEGMMTGGAPAGTGGAVGTGGADMATGGTGGDPAATGGAGMGAVPCPADATFCADFETADLPAGAIYNRNGAPADFTTDFAVDNTVFYAGGGALRVKTTGQEASSAYKMLAVPAPGAQFWTRVYIRADAELGQGTVSASEHNRFLIAASGSETNTTDALEVAEDCGIALNHHDTVVRPASAGSNCETPLRLPANEWYCLEASFNGTTGDTQVYIDGVLQIDAPAWEAGKGAFTHLKFGVDHLHPIERQVWFDNIAVGPTRPGCD